jgi:hypothetical protein
MHHCYRGGLQIVVFLSPGHLLAVLRLKTCSYGVTSPYPDARNMMYDWCMSTRISHPTLPYQTRLVADVIGVERALYLVANWRRTNIANSKHYGERICIYVPATLPVDHELVRVMGWNDAQKLVQAFRGEILQLSTCADVFKAWRNDAIAHLHKTGVPSKKIAEHFKISPRTVERATSHMRKIKANP